MISIFDFLFIEHLTQVGDFSPLVDSGATVDHYNVLKLFSCYQPHSKIYCTFQIWSWSRNRSIIEIQLLSHRKTGKIATSRKNRN